MKSEDKHSWVKSKLESNNYIDISICSICNCKRYRQYHRGKFYYAYSREKITHEVRPDCFGPIPINEQTID